MASHNDGLYEYGMNTTTYFYGTWPFPTKRGGWNFWGHNQLNANSRFWVNITN